MRWIFRRPKNTWQCMCVNFLSPSLTWTNKRTNEHTHTHTHTHRTQSLSLSHTNTLTLPSWWAASWSRGRQASWESGRRSSCRLHAPFHHQCGAVSTFPSHPRFPPLPPPLSRHLEHNHSRPMNPICQHIQQTERGREQRCHTHWEDTHFHAPTVLTVQGRRRLRRERSCNKHTMGSFLCASRPYLVIFLWTTELFQMTRRWQSEATVG